MQSALNRMKQQYDALEKKKRDRERTLEDLGEKIIKLKARTGEIKTNKEYQALLKEIETFERERSSIEDGILTVMEEADVLRIRIKKEEENFSIHKEKVEALQRQIEKEKAELQKELSTFQELRAQYTAMIDREVYDQYIMLLNIHRGLAVNEVKEEICQGCNMNIPPQLFVEIKRNEEIYNCPHCRRFLYYKERIP